MRTILLCVPIKKDKIADFKTFVKELLGFKKKDYKELHVRYGITNTRIWMHTLNDKSYILFTHDLSDDLETHMRKFANSKHPFDLWFAEQLEDFYNIEDVDAMSAQPPEFIGEFKLQK
jgi:hypothetical protein